MPLDKGMEMADGIEPVAKAGGGAAHEGEKRFGILTQAGGRMAAKESAGEIVLDGEAGGGFGESETRPLGVLESLSCAKSILVRFGGAGTLFVV